MADRKDRKVTEIEKARRREDDSAGPPNARSGWAWRVLGVSLVIIVPIMIILYYVYPR